MAVPEEYSTAEKFPEKFIVDGYIVCIDVSADLDVAGNQQRVFLERLLPAILGVKKTHVVVALTKFDIAREGCVAVAMEILSKMKRQLMVVEVSALKGVNVDVCFLVLAHMIDSKLPRTKIPTFSESDAQLRERVRRNEESFQPVLDRKVTDFSLPLAVARQLVRGEVEYLLLQELCGSNRTDRLIRAKLNYLREIAIKSKLANYLDYLLMALELFLPKVKLTDNVSSCKQRVKNHPKFSGYFFEDTSWRDNDDLLKEREGGRVPFTLLDEEGESLLRMYIEKVRAERGREGGRVCVCVCVSW